MVITFITGNSIIKYPKLMYQNDSSSPDNRMFNVVGVKVEDPDKDHEEDPVNTMGIVKELTSESRVKDAFSAQEVFV